MIEGLRPYPESVEAGIPWAGRLPAHWALRRGKALFRKMDRPVEEGDEVVTCFRDGVVTLRKNRRLTGFTEAIFELGYQRVCRGDLVIHAMDAFAGAIGVSDSDGKATPVYSVCQPIGDANARYYAHVVREMARAQWIVALSRGIRERSTDFRFESFGRQALPAPPPDEQALIVRFLDHATGKIDRAIRAKRRVIALLNEQKQAIIHRAVTRGLDPNVPLKDSGIPWLGEIPAHWEVLRLKSLLRGVDQGKSPLAEGGLAENGAWGVLKSGCVNRGVFRQLEHKRLASDYAIIEDHVVRVGDVIVSRASGSPQLVGSCARVDALDYQLVLSDKTFRLKLKGDVVATFVVYALNSPYYRRQVEQAISGAEGLANNLPLSELRTFVVAVPPVEEANTIGEHLDIELSALTAVTNRTESEIALLREYTTRLVADVVTGKLDVRAAAEMLPVEATPIDGPVYSDMIEEEDDSLEEEAA